MEPPRPSEVRPRLLLEELAHRLHGQWALHAWIAASLLLAFLLVLPWWGFIATASPGGGASASFGPWQLCCGGRSPWTASLLSGWDEGFKTTGGLILLALAFSILATYLYLMGTLWPRRRRVYRGVAALATLLSLFVPLYVWYEVPRAWITGVESIGSLWGSYGSPYSPLHMVWGPEVGWYFSFVVAAILAGASRLGDLGIRENEIEGEFSRDPSSSGTCRNCGVDIGTARTCWRCSRPAER